MKNNFIEQGIFLLLSVSLFLFSGTAPAPVLAEEEIIKLPADFSFIDADGHLKLLQTDGKETQITTDQIILDYSWYQDGEHILLLLQNEETIFLSKFSLTEMTSIPVITDVFNFSDYRHLDLGTFSKDDQKLAVAYGYCTGILTLSSGEMQDISCFEPVEDEDGNQVSDGIRYLDPAFNPADDALIATAAASDSTRIILYPFLNGTPEPEHVGCCFYPQFTSDGLNLFAYGSEDYEPGIFFDLGEFRQGILQISLIDFSIQSVHESDQLLDMDLLDDNAHLLVETLNTASGSSEIHLLGLEENTFSLVAAGENPKWRPHSSTAEPEPVNPDETQPPIVINAEIDSLLAEHQAYIEELSTAVYTSAGDQSETEFSFLNPQFHAPFRQNLLQSSLNEGQMTEALLRLTLQDQLNKTLLEEYSQINAYTVEVELTLGNLLAELSRVNETLYGADNRLTAFSDQMITSFGNRWSSSVSSIDLRIALQNGLFSAVSMTDTAETRKTLAKNNFSALSLMSDAYLDSYDRILNNPEGEIFSGELEEMYTRYAKTQIALSEIIHHSEQSGIGSINLTKIKEMTSLLKNLDLEDTAGSFESLSDILTEMRLILNSVGEENTQGESLDCLVRTASRASELLFLPDTTPVVSCQFESYSENWVDSASWNLLRPWWTEKMQDYMLVLSATSKSITYDSPAKLAAAVMKNVQFSGPAGKNIAQEAEIDPLAELNTAQSDLDSAMHMAELLLSAPNGSLPSDDTAYLLERIFIHNHLLLEYNLGVQAYLANPAGGDKVIETQIKNQSALIEQNLQEILDFVSTADFSGQKTLTGPQISYYPDKLSGTSGYQTVLDLKIRNIGSAPIHSGSLSVFVGETELETRTYESLLYGQEIDVHISLPLPPPHSDHISVIFRDSERFDLVRIPLDTSDPLLNENIMEMMNSICPGAFTVTAGIFAVSIVGLIIVGILSLISRRGSASSKSQN